MGATEFGQCFYTELKVRGLDTADEALTRYGVDEIFLGLITIAEREAISYAEDGIKSFSDKPSIA